MKRLILSLLLLSSFAWAEEPMRTPKVQIALLLDNSGSMSGLINQARSQLWKVVNQFASAKQYGKAVRVEIALYEYGETVKRLSPLTSNLDAVSEQLFSLGIRGGDEHCGQVITAAVNELEWSGNPDDLKLIYIAGNEEFTQGPVSPERAIAAAKKKGISVNAIHCGGEEPTWRQGARLAGTQLLLINHNAAVADIATPHDAELATLSSKLNTTYLAYGAKGGGSLARQEAQDKAVSAAAPSIAAERAKAKSGRAYNNADWDLVDAVKDGKKLKEIKKADLPAALQPLSDAELEKAITKQSEERAQIQKQIAELSAKRQAYLTEAAKKAPAGPARLDEAVTQSARAAGEAKPAFTFH